MTGRRPCEFALIRYVPDVVKGEFTNIGVVLRGEGEPPQVRFTRDWARVRCLDPDADTDLLEALEAEMSARLEQEAAGASETARPLLSVLEDSLSNSVQITDLRGTLAESMPAEMEQLMRLYVEPLKIRAERRRPTGRAAIAGTMREQFERAGVWRLMRKRIAAASYTQSGDPLRLDCGYRFAASPGGPDLVKLFQAVSLDNDVEAAKSLAYSAPALRNGVARVESADLELTAIIEPIAQVSDADEYSFGVRTMEEARIRVLTINDLARVAETARRELRV